MSSKQRGFIDMGFVAILLALLVIICTGVIVWQNARYNNEVNKKRANSATEIDPEITQ